MATNLVPKEEAFIDCTGRHISFVIDEVPTPNDGYLFEANETTDSKYGYQLSAWSLCPSDCLQKLKIKIRRELARKYLIETTEESPEMSHDKMWGIINENGLVVDGKLISWFRLADMLGGKASGSQFHLSISDCTD